MIRRLALAVLIFGAPALGQAAEPPERLLSAGTQIYLRWDGIDAHRMAYESTALGKIVQGDMGKFVGSVFADLTDLANKQFVVPRLMSGISPDRLQKIQADAAAAPQLLDTLSHHGLIIAVEVRQVMPPQAQLTLILPKAGAKPQSFLSALRLGASLAQLDVKEAKILNRSVHRLDVGPAHAAWWIEGEDAVVVAGTDPAEVAVKRAVDSAGRLADKPLFQRVQGFKDFETGARGFVDVAGLVQVGRSFDKNVSKVIDELGVDGLKSIVIYSGFDGAAERGVLEIDLAATERKGILRL